MDDAWVLHCSNAVLVVYLINLQESESPLDACTFDLNLQTSLLVKQFLHGQLERIRIMILMLNMLIAMMAKTFDRIYESAMVDFQYHFIGNLLQMVEEPAVPPILRMLGVPWMVCSTCWRWISRKRSELSENNGTASPQAVLLRNSSFHAMHKEQQQRDSGLREVMIRVDTDGKLTDHYHCVDLLYKSVTSFVSEHASDTQVQDDLWRKQMAQKLFLMDKELRETKIDTMNKLDKLTEQMDALLRSTARQAQPMTS